MQAHKLSHTLYFDPADDLSLEDFVEVFHAWIRDGVLEDVMIDVADYVHVPDGPGVLLVCHEGHYVVEQRHGRYMLSYHHRRGGSEAGLSERIGGPLRRLLTAAARLEQEPALAGRLRFRTDELRIRVDDRLLAPNEDATLDEVRPELEAVLGRVWGDEAAPALEREGEPRELFTVRARPGSSPPLRELLAAARVH